MSRFEKIKYYHRNYLNIFLSKEERKKIENEFSNLVFEGVVTSKYVAGAFEFIVNNNNKYDFYISTATPTYEINKIIKRNNICQYFKGVYGSPEGKDIHLKKILKHSKHINNKIIFIGDSLNDRNAANNNNIIFVARIRDNINELKGEKYKIND